MRASGCEEDEELDFRLIFGEELEAPHSVLGGSDLETDDSPAYSKGPSFTVNRPIGIPRHRAPVRAGMHSPPPRPAADAETYESQPARLIHLGGCKFLACPSIQITSISPGDGSQEMELADEDCGPEGWGEHRLPPLPAGRDHLYLPLDPFGYRDCSLSPSSASSFSSRGWLSDAASSCGSASHVYDDVEPELSEAALRFALGSSPASPSCRAWPADEAWPLSGSPCPSPGSGDDGSRLSPRAPASGPPSRPSSPCGKRRHSGPEAYYYYYHHRSGSARPSPSPSPAPSRRGSVTDEALSPQEAPSSPLLLLLEGGVAVTGDIPHKARRTSQEQSVALFREAEEGDGEAGGSPYLGLGGEEGPSVHQLAKKDAAPMEYLTVPSPFVWSKARVGGHSPIFRPSALPPLDWPLPSHYEHLELKIEVQPKTHHRAHYETEGSRGAVKATAGGHPVVKLQGYTEKPLTLQMFIGTADDRNLRPHAFYQVHRITGKMVATSSQEAVVSTTKVLEVSLLPENNMTANIDCAGILKLRNSDIELRKGETDIGRKNTRVKLVFRVHVPQPNGKVVSLQVASVPIECSQRSAHELPQVESCNLNSCPVIGGEELLLTGCNFLPESKVVFIEKGPDGRPQWEVDAQVNRAKSTEALIVAEVPPYRNQTLTRPAQVCFLVCNGKRKRSPCQCFQYLPVLVKEEPYEEFEVGPPSPLREYPPHVPAASLGQLLSAISGPGTFIPASPPVPLPNLGCPAREAFGKPCLLSPPVAGLPALLLDAEWNEACELVPPGFGCSLAQPDHGHPLAQSDHGHSMTQPNHGHPLTQSDHGHLLTQSDHGHPLTQSDHDHPLTQPNHGHPLTQSNYSHPLAQPDHGHPLAQPDHGHPLAQPDHGHPLTQSNHSHPLTQSNHGHPLAHLPLGHSCSYSPPDWATPHSLASPSANQTGPDCHLPLAPVSPFYPAPSNSVGHTSLPAQLPNNDPGPTTPLATQRERASYATEPSVAQASTTRHLTACSPAFPTGPQPTSPAPPQRHESGVLAPACPMAYGTCAFQDAKQRAGTPEDPPDSTPSAHLKTADPCLFQESDPPPSGHGQADGERRPGAPPEKQAADAEGGDQECDVSFSTIPIQGITLDDVNEIIGRDLTDVPESLRADGAAEKP